jgi:hypothetical protein
MVNTVKVAASTPRGTYLKLKAAQMTPTTAAIIVAFKRFDFSLMDVSPPGKSVG